MRRLDSIIARWSMLVPKIGDQVPMPGHAEIASNKIRTFNISMPRVPPLCYKMVGSLVSRF